jgi:IS5 family transposase
MKMHIGVDSRTGLAHSAVVTAANVHDKHPLSDLLHGNEQASMATAPMPARRR